MGDFALDDLATQCLRDVVLADDLVKSLRPILAVERLIVHPERWYSGGETALRAVILDQGSRTSEMAHAAPVQSEAEGRAIQDQQASGLGPQGRPGRENGAYPCGSGRAKALAFPSWRVVRILRAT